MDGGPDMDKINDVVSMIDEHYNEFKQKWDNTPFDRLPKFNPKLKCNLRETVYGLYYEDRKVRRHK